MVRVATACGVSRNGREEVESVQGGGDDSAAGSVPESGRGRGRDRGGRCEGGGSEGFRGGAGSDAGESEVGGKKAMMLSFFVCWNKDGGKEKGRGELFAGMEIDREVVGF